MENINVHYNYGKSYKSTGNKFPAGELNVNIGKEHFGINHIQVIARLKSSDAIMELLMVTDALKRNHPEARMILKIGYFAYGRQDRVCNKGEAFSLKVMCDLINNLNYDNVYICDPHSDVTPALLNNCTVISMDNIIYFFNELKTDDYLLLSPDAGANKKCLKLAETCNISTMIRADKIRNLKTGEITGTEIFCGYLEGQDVLITDDICYGGRSFIEIAKVLKNEKGAGKVVLYVTHGIFSKGLNVFDGLIDEIYTTNTYFDKDADDGNHDCEVFVRNLL